MYVCFTTHRQSGGWLVLVQIRACNSGICLGFFVNLRERVVYKLLLTETLWLSVPPYIRKILVSIIDSKFDNLQLSPFYGHLLLLRKFVDTA